MLLHSLTFDLGKPYGPVFSNPTSSWICKASPKTIEFEAPASCGYDCRVHLTSLKKAVATPHVLSLALRGLVQDYGWNATRVHMGPDLFVDSQEFGLADACVLTLVVSTDAVDVYVEKETTEPAQSLAREGDWADLPVASGMLRHRRMALKGALKAPPELSLSMMHGNRVAIVSPWETRAYAHAKAVVSEGSVYA